MIAMNIENIVMIIIKHLEMNKIWALNNPWRVDIPLNKWTKPNLSFLFFLSLFFIITKHLQLNHISSINNP